METSHYLIFFACFLLLAAMLIFMSATKKGGVGFTSYLRNRGKLRRIRFYNEAYRHKLKRKHPDVFVAALLPVPDESGNDLALYISWTNFLPAIIPTWEVVGIIMTEVDHDKGMVSFSGVVTPAELRNSVSPESIREMDGDYSLVEISSLSSEEKRALRDTGAERQLPPGLASLGLLKGGAAAKETSGENHG